MSSWFCLICLFIDLILMPFYLFGGLFAYTLSLLIILHCTYWNELLKCLKVFSMFSLWPFLFTGVSCLAFIWYKYQPCRYPVVHLQGNRGRLSLKVRMMTLTVNLSGGFRQAKSHLLDMPFVVRAAPESWSKYTTAIPIKSSNIYRKITWDLAVFKLMILQTWCLEVK